MAPHNEVKERILRAAAELFMERGFAGTTVREIGERAKVGQSSLYHHARSKGELLRELHGRQAHEQFELLEKIITSNETPTAQLRATVSAIMSVVHTHRPVVTVYLREGHSLSEEARAEVNQERDKMHSLVDIIIRRGIESGEFRGDLDVHLTRLAILGMCNWSYQWYRPDGPQSMEKISEYFADLAVQGVLPERAPKARKATRGK